MQYLGGKSKLARKIVAEILRAAPETQGFCEPFMGGGAVTLELAKHRPTLAGDGFRGLVNMYQAVRQGLRLPKITDEIYREAKARAETRDPWVVAIGFACSYGGKWFGGHARGKDPTKNDFVGYFNRWADRFCLSSVLLVPDGLDYTGWRQYAGPGVTFYLDPPYEGTEGYPGVVFDYLRFFEEARALRAAGSRVFLSEFEAPFRIVTEFPRDITVNRVAGKPNAVQKVDRLYEVDP